MPWVHGMRRWGLPPGRHQHPFAVVFWGRSKDQQNTLIAHGTKNGGRPPGLIVLLRLALRDAVDVAHPGADRAVLAQIDPLASSVGPVGLLDERAAGRYHRLRTSFPLAYCSRSFVAPDLYRYIRSPLPCATP